MTKRLVLFGLLCGALPALAAAQSNQDPCVSGGVDILTTGQAFDVKWTVQQQVTNPDVPGQMVAHRYNGFVLQVDTQPEIPVDLTTEVGVCPAGTPRASDKVYAYHLAGVQKGNHSLSILLWNWAPLLNPDGTPQLNPDGTVKYSTTQKLRGTPVVTPFVAADAMQPTLLGPPFGPFNTRIIK
jgi:hypothetical protein